MLGTLNTSSGNNISNVSAVTKTPPSTIKNTVKDSKLFSTGKTIDPVWLAQTKVEAANLVNANKLLVKYQCLCLHYGFDHPHFIEFVSLYRVNLTPVKWTLLFSINYNVYNSYF